MRLRDLRPPTFRWTRPGAAFDPRRGDRPELGRFLARSDEPIAVLLIGARVNSWRNVRQWVPTVAGMLPMLRELSADPDSGLLGYRVVYGPPRDFMVIQYWRRAGDIRNFSHDQERTHYPRQEAFVERFVASAGAVGIWHEMLSVRAGAYQALYGDTPRQGLGAIMGVDPATRNESGRGYHEGEDPDLVEARARVAEGGDADGLLEDLRERRKTGA